MPAFADARSECDLRVGTARETGEIMLNPEELAALFRRDLTRLIQELTAFPEDAMLWRIVPGIANSAGNLTLHLEGNLREFIGRQLGGVAYQRQRPLEFSSSGITTAELSARIESVRELVPPVIAALSLAQCAATYPENVYGAPMSTGQFVLSLYGHLSYHLGQIDYLRRVLSAGSAVPFAGL
jgi:hypothetical protein